MSLSQKMDNPEIRTAVVEGAAGAGGTSEDVLQLEADRDARIVAIHGSKNSNNAFIEISKSSSASVNLSGGSQRDGDVNANTVFTLGGNSGTVNFGDWDGSGQFVDWEENEELHVHQKNNTGSGIDYHITLYYVEESDC